MVLNEDKIDPRELAPIVAIAEGISLAASIVQLFSDLESCIRTLPAGENTARIRRTKRELEFKVASLYASFAACGKTFLQATKFDDRPSVLETAWADAKKSKSRRHKPPGKPKSGVQPLGSPRGSF